MKLKFFEPRLLQEICMIDDAEKKRIIKNFCNEIEQQGIQETDIPAMLSLMIKRANDEQWDTQIFLAAIKSIIGAFDYTRELRWTGGVK